jgi:hypothetical protein
MFKFVFSFVMSVVLFSAGMPAVWADTALSGKEIKQLINGNTAVGGRQKVQTQQQLLTTYISFQTYFGPDQQLVEKGFDTAMGSAYPAHGSWKIRKNKLCFTFSDSLRNAGKEMCRKVIRKDDGTYELLKKGGEVKRTWREILPGNPYKLK